MNHTVHLEAIDIFDDAPGGNRSEDVPEPVTAHRQIQSHLPVQETEEPADRKAEQSAEDPAAVAKGGAQEQEENRCHDDSSEDSIGKVDSPLDVPGGGQGAEEEKLHRRVKEQDRGEIPPAAAAPELSGEIGRTTQP